MSPRWEAVIGLEVHVQLRTASKIFCGCATRYGALPNTQVCPVCSGQPGALPVLNRQAVHLAFTLALATGCTVHRQSRFVRKSYFYPDLPKGYQITQHEQPLAEAGALALRSGGRRREIGITRIQLEEDAGKSLHPAGAALSQVDLNRAGVPLCELVTAPELRSPAEAAEFLRALRSLVRALGISDGNLEQGSLRCDANLSLRPAGQQALGTRTEVKNLNSFRFVQRALEVELSRQQALLERGEQVVQETRQWNAALGLTESLRTKEEAEDYRFFPEPDLPPLTLEPELLAELAAALPELPLARRERLMAELGLSEALATELTREQELADYLERAVAAGAPPRAAAHWIARELLARLTDPREALAAPVTPAGLAELLRLVADGTLSSKLAQTVWLQMWQDGRSAAAIVAQAGLAQQSDAVALREVVARVLAQNPKQVAAYQAGKVQLLGYFVGQVMQATAGQANPQLVNALLKQALDP